MNPLKNMPEAQRKAAYIGIAAVLTILGVFNLVDADKVPDFLNVIGIILGVSVPAIALPNMNSKKK